MPRDITLPRRFYYYRKSRRPISIAYSRGVRESSTSDRAIEDVDNRKNLHTHQLVRKIKCMDGKSI